MIINVKYNYYYALGICLIGMIFGEHSKIIYLFLGCIIYYMLTSKDGYNASSASLIYMLFFTIGLVIHRLYEDYQKTKKDSDKCKITVTVDKNVSDKTFNNLDFNPSMKFLLGACRSGNIKKLTSTYFNQ